MALKWNTVGPEHVRAACERVAAERTRPTASGLVVWHHQQALPAKEVLRNAYRLANSLPDTEKVNFASGEATLRLLISLGFSAGRIGAKRSHRDESKPETGEDA